MGRLDFVVEQVLECVHTYHFRSTLQIFLDSDDLMHLSQQGVDHFGRVLVLNGLLVEHAENIRFKVFERETMDLLASKCLPIDFEHLESVSKIEL